MRTSADNDPRTLYVGSRFRTKLTSVVYPTNVSSVCTCGRSLCSRHASVLYHLGESFNSVVCQSLDRPPRHSLGGGGRRGAAVGDRLRIADVRSHHRHEQSKSHLVVLRWLVRLFGRSVGPSLVVRSLSFVAETKRSPGRRSVVALVDR